jgi:hypothetical protein
LLCGQFKSVVLKTLGITAWTKNKVGGYGKAASNITCDEKGNSSGVLRRKCECMVYSGSLGLKERLGDGLQVV